VLVDCGRSVRLLFTGTPLGRRILDLTLGDNPCSIAGSTANGCASSCSRTRGALGALRRYIPQYLSPQGIAEWERLRA
jgi:hypothetical protein